MKYDVIVIGAGPAGLAAAIEAKKKTESVLLIERDREAGGILNQCIHNGFGLHEFKLELTGPEYAERFIREAEAMGIEIKLNTMVMEVTEDRKIIAVNEDGVHYYEAGAIVLAMGCRERTAGAIALSGYRPAGVMTAGAAQRLMNMEGLEVGKEVVVYGSGDIGLIMARRMTLEGAKVKAVVEIMPFSSGLNRNIAQCLEDYDIPLLLHHKITRVFGKHRVEAVEITALDENGKETDDREVVSCDTLLLSIGLIPENELSEKAGVTMDRLTKGAVVTEDCATSVEGIFACGNVLHVHDIVDFVTAEARTAGSKAADFALGAKLHTGACIPTRPERGIRYVLPQSVHADEKEHVKLSMRTDGIYRKQWIKVKSNGEEIYKKAGNVLVPSEMIILELGPEELANVKGEITVELEER